VAGVSADYWVIAHKPSCDKDDCTCPSSDSDLNVTRNLTPMLREAGLFRVEGFQGDLLGAPCSELAGIADGTLRTLEADPDRFKALNPANGWGDYEGAVDFVRRLRDLCQSWSHIPGAVIEGNI
jgi:hypothetical protein